VAFGNIRMRARMFSKEIFNEEAKKKRGVRYGGSDQQPGSLQGILALVKELRLQLLADKAALVRDIVKSATIVDGGRVFCATAYYFEGDNPLTFVGHKVFAKLARLVAEMMYPGLEKAAKIAPISSERIFFCSRCQQAWKQNFVSTPRS
jgi:hypothetical protein